MQRGCLPLGLAHGWKVIRPVTAGHPVSWADVAVDASSTAVRVRREMEEAMGARAAAASAVPLSKVLEGTAR
jgi:predicted homoserine dehydrogenase-like protein